MAQSKSNSRIVGRDVKTIGKHVANALKEELAEIPVVAKFAITATDGKTYQVEHYNLEMITSIGYRVKSARGILIIDEEVYLISHSLKDLGKKLFAFSKMDVMIGSELLSRL